MAFTALPVLVPRMAATRGSGNGSSKRKAVKSKPSRRRAARLPQDPLLNDSDSDQTAITTYVSCGKCFNSMMLAPEVFLDKPALQIRCNVCDLQSTVTVDMLETTSGEPFDVVSFRVKEAILRTRARQQQQRLEQQELEKRQ